ncbi:MAG: hypothetical protein DRR06_09220 [Gammaproteobacteria bacterium]|nr:MAG: hypothetical protein DRR06_09220 [Gammaproteobacteria bacterium]
MPNKEATIEQPIRGTQDVNRSVKRVHRINHKSIQKLRELQFDPLVELVKTYDRLVIEEAYWRNIRDNVEPDDAVEEMVEIDPDAPQVVTLGADGKVVQARRRAKGVKQKRPRYSNIAHTKIMELMSTLSDKLMRYGYARVPETNTLETTKAKPLMIKLSPKKTHTINADTGEVIENE